METEKNWVKIFVNCLCSFEAFVIPLESLKGQPQLPGSMFENDPCHSTRVKGTLWDRWNDTQTCVKKPVSEHFCFVGLQNARFWMCQIWPTCFIVNQTLPPVFSPATTPAAHGLDTLDLQDNVPMSLAICAGTLRKRMRVKNKWDIIMNQWLMQTKIRWCQNPCSSTNFTISDIVTVCNFYDKNRHGSFETVMDLFCFLFPLFCDDIHVYIYIQGQKFRLDVAKSIFTNYFSSNAFPDMNLKSHVFQVILVSQFLKLFLWKKKLAATHLVVQLLMDSNCFQG